MKCDLNSELIKEIIDIAKDCGIKKVILFGSRARGDYGPRSDIDLAVLGGCSAKFHNRIEEETHTLLMFDVVDLERQISDELKREIEEGGLILYEKV